MKQVPKPIDADYFDINVLCWVLNTDTKPTTLIYQEDYNQVYQTKKQPKTTT